MVIHSTSVIAANLDAALRRKIAARPVNDDRSQPEAGYGQLKAYQQYLDDFYRAK
jgi:hypothetical protein